MLCGWRVYVSGLLDIPTPVHRSTNAQHRGPADGTNMAANFVQYVIFATLIHLVITVFIQDTFIRCNYDNHADNQLHYRETRTRTGIGCALACLPDGKCTGYDVCPLEDEDRKDEEYICKMKNSTRMQSCEAHDQNGISPPCESYRRVSKHSVWIVVSL
jgi:hypothetical protein